jgi:hypothetical protein
MTARAGSKLRELKGTGMIDEQVRDFLSRLLAVNEDTLAGVFFGSLESREGMKPKRKQLTLIIGRDRVVGEVIRI